jgi:hypothetical protein
MTLTESLNHIQHIVTTWQDVSTVPHRFGGVQFQWHTVEIGHIHRNGMVDIPFTRKLREVLVAQGYTEVHHFLPDTGWTSFYIGKNGDAQQAIELLRLSYVQKVHRRTQLNVPRELTALGFNHAVQALLMHTTPDASDEQEQSETM